MRVLGMAALLVVMAAPLRADTELGTARGAGAPDSALEHWLAQPGITGDWRGWRPWLDHRGVELSAAYVADVLGNPVGGMRQAVQYYHDVYAGVSLDLARLAAIPGATIDVSMSWRAGTSLSDEDIGNVFNVAQTCCEPGVRLVTLAWQQALFDRRVVVRAGHLVTGNDFATSPLYALFVTSGIDSNPGSVPFNIPFSEYPEAAWGGMVEAWPERRVALKLGIYNGSLANPGGDVVFAFDDVLVVAEAGYHPTVALFGERLPGHYKLGGYYDSGRFRRFDAPPDSDLPRDVEYGNAGLYLLADQMVYREPGTKAEGLTPFVALVGAPDAMINPFPFFFDAGLVYQGPLPSRSDDVALFGIVYGSFSSDLRAAQRGTPEGQQDFEMVLEWSYIIQLTGWLQLQPDVQYVIKPGGTGQIPDALVLGAQIALAF